MSTLDTPRMIDANEIAHDSPAGTMRGHLARASSALDALVGAAVLEIGGANECCHIVDLGQQLQKHILGALAVLNPDEDEDDEADAGILAAAAKETA